MNFIVATILIGAAVALPAADASATAQVPKPEPKAETQEAAPRPAPAAPEQRPPGQRFHDTLSDGSAGPEMVVVPAGRFRMGSPEDEANRQGNEGPAHEVTVKAFALGRTELSRGEFGRFVQATGYKTDAERDSVVTGKTGTVGCHVFGDSALKPDWKAGTGWRNPGYTQADNHPVVCVSWNDASAYLEWLSRETGKHYRLATEAEFEYATRAGSQTPWPWGTDRAGGCETSNGADDSGRAGIRDRFGLVESLMFASSGCDDGIAFTGQVGRLKPNAFGLHDTIGSVYEWVQDCYHKSYVGAPTDGSAFEEPGCGARVLRSSAWSDQPEYSRSACRLGQFPMSRRQNIGMRVASDP